MKLIRRDLEHRSRVVEAAAIVCRAVEIAGRVEDQPALGIDPIAADRGEVVQDRLDVVSALRWRQFENGSDAIDASILGGAVEIRQ